MEEDRDVIRVVRCKDYVWAKGLSKDSKFLICNNDQFRIEPRDGYCQNGIRRNTNDPGKLREHT